MLAMIPLLTVGGWLAFRQFSSQINDRADKELVYEEVQWIQYIEAATAGGGNFILRSPDLLIYPTEKEPTLYPEISTITGTKARENSQIPFRRLTHVVNINGTPYQIVIRKSQEQKLALVNNIIFILLVVFGVVFLGILIFNWLISRRLWKPFHQSLNQVQNLALQKMETIHFGKTNVQEFNELNAALNAMVGKIQSDYLNMKEFIENAAHEMQTPLAVAQSKLELLLQDTSLNDEQLSAIAQTTEAINRLNKLNQSLLLLAKIENNQFEPTGDISVVDITKKYLRLFDEIIKDKNLTAQTDFEDEFLVRLHPFLGDSLVSNLLGNAIKYNGDGGHINIRINHHQFCITNTSSLPPLNSQQLFQRFAITGNTGKHSTGLGLAIVKRIVDASNLFIDYQNKDGMHSFCIYRQTNNRKNIEKDLP